jgi:hypothetical protein
MVEWMSAASASSSHSSDFQVQYSTSPCPLPHHSHSAPPCPRAVPARGKSYVAHKLAAYAAWRGTPCRAFNVGKARRLATPVPQNAAFFSATNEEAVHLRDALALAVLRESLDWLQSTGGGVAILDATNTTAARRRLVLEEVSNYSAGLHRPPPQVVFLEMVCTDAAVLRSNMLEKVRNSPDYRDMPLDTALADLQSRISEYERVYEPLSESEDEGSPLGPLKFIKLLDLREKIVCRRIWGQLQYSLVNLLMAIHIAPRPVFFVRAGECDGEDGRSTIPMLPRQQAAPSSVVVPSQVGGGVSTGGCGTPILPVPQALSAGLRLNARGQRFAELLAAFLLRRTCGGTLAPVESEENSHSCDVPLRWSSSEVVLKRFKHRIFVGSDAHVSVPLAEKVLGERSDCGGAPSGIGRETLQEEGVSISQASSYGISHYGDAPAARDCGAQGSAHLETACEFIESDTAIFDAPPAVFTSTLSRTLETVSRLPLPTQALSALNPMETGICLGVPLKYLRSQFPAEWEKWMSSTDRVRHRIAGGAESLLDVVARLAPVVIEIERCRRPVVVVSHLSTLQVTQASYNPSGL